ncbi:MAG: cation diffusion facilitator family transporter, partial [Candidatus Omnitrophica bacterium]|nr:cation diffusion facilitator family transporter [Candidatus Omnitrophota bacterium]
TGIGLLIEFVGGILSNSLALISDAGHMLTHLFALGMSYFAIILSLRPVTKKRTYGFYRAEVLAAFINGMVLIPIAFYIVYESVLRSLHPQQIRIQEMLLVALIGLAINGASIFLLLRVSRQDLNIKSAILHELGDIVSSVAVVGGAFIILFSKNYIIDPILAFFISILIIIWAVKLLIESGNILLEATPKHLDIDDVIKAVKEELPAVHEVHHMHLWTISSSLYALTAHVVIDDCSVSRANELLHKINRLLKERFHIEHTNIQFECLVKKEDKR